MKEKWDGLRDLLIGWVGEKKAVGKRQLAMAVPEISKNRLLAVAVGNGGSWQLARQDLILLTTAEIRKDKRKKIKDKSVPEEICQLPTATANFRNQKRQKEKDKRQKGRRAQGIAVNLRGIYMYFIRIV